MVRSPNDIIFGTEAAHLHSKDRFHWTDRDLDIFVRHVFNTPDICLQPVLVNKLITELHLNGYEDITTKAGHSVHEIIKRKVIHKAEAVRNDLNKETDQMGIITKRLGLDRANNVQASFMTTNNRAPLGQVQAGMVSQANPPNHMPSSVATASLQNPVPSTQEASTEVKGRTPGRDYSSWNNLEQERQPEFEDEWWPFKGDNWNKACRSPRANPTPAVTPGPDSREHTRRQEDRRRSAPGQRNEQVLCMELPDDHLAVGTLIKPPKPSLFAVLDAQDDDKVKEKAKKEKDDDDFPTFYVTVDHDKLYNWTTDGLTRDRRRLMMAVLGKERGLSLAQELHMIQERIMAMGGEARAHDGLISGEDGHPLWPEFVVVFLGLGSL